MRVFIAGGNGFIGSRVVRLLLEDGNTVRCLLRESSRTNRLDGLKYERCTGDLCDFSSLARGMEGCDSVIHVAGISSWADIRSNSLEDIVIEGSRHLFDASRRAGNLRCVFVSSAAAINASSEPVIYNENSAFELESSSLRYAIAKHEVELLASEYVKNGLPIVVVNPVETYGPGDTDLITARNILDIMKSYPALTCTGGTGIAHVDDVADGIVRAWRNGRSGERYILGGDNLTVEQIVKLTLKIAGQRKPIVRMPNALLRWIVHLIAAIGLPTPVLPEVLDYATRYFFMDTSKAKKELGYKTRSAAEVLTPVINWLCEAGYV